jgi:ABC-type phosphate transport system permease subunit
MSYNEKENIINIFSGLIIAIGYSWIIYQKHLSGQFDLTTDFEKWGIIFLIFMGVSIVARIIIYIIFHIINAIATGKEEKLISDERDKLIKLKATRNAHYSFFGVFMLAIIALAIGMPVYGIFIAFVIASLISELIDNFSQIYYSRRGV